MRANKHLLLWSSVAALLVVLSAIAKENFFQDWRTAQEHVREALPADEAERFEIKLRQIVAPRVGATDRCVSCHVGMAPGEQGIAGDRVYGPHVDVFHLPEEFGCTICHGGQGRATTTADAHGNVAHWPEPMLPKKYLYAGCGTCHSFVGIPPYERLRAGQALVAKLDCLDCHRIDDAPADAGAKEPAGPDLTLVGHRGVGADWVERHGGSLPEMTTDERELVRAYLASRVGAPALVEAQATFNGLGCRGCHEVDGIGGDSGPSLTRVGLKDPARTPFANVDGPSTLQTYFEKHFRDPARVVPGSRMLKQNLTEEQIHRLTYYVFSLRRRELPTGLWPKDRLLITRFGGTGFVDDGPSLFAAFCSGCHGQHGRGGLVNTNSSRKDFPPLNKLAERYQLYDREDVDTVVAELREHGALSADRPLDVARWNITLAQDGMVRTLLVKGNPSGKVDPNGPDPIDMPAWGHILSEEQMTVLVMHLLSGSDLDDDEDEGDDDDDDGDDDGDGDDDDDGDDGDDGDEGDEG